MLHSPPLDPLQSSVGMQPLMHGIAKGTVEVAVENDAMGNASLIHGTTLPDLAQRVHP